MKLSPDRALYLRFGAAGRSFAFPLAMVDQVVGYAMLNADISDRTRPQHPAFIGWLDLRGTAVPVFDTGLHFGGEAVPHVLSSRILIFLHTDRRIGLLTADVMDTTAASELGETEVLESALIVEDLLQFVPTAETQP